MCQRRCLAAGPSHPEKLAKNILIYRLGSLGDMGIAIPALRVIRRAFPTAHCTLLTNIPVSAKAAPAASVLDGQGLVDDYLAYPVGTRSPKRLLGLLTELRRNRYDLIVNLSAWRGVWPWRRDAIFFRLSGAGHYIGFKREEGGPLRMGSDGRAEPEAARLLRRVATLGSADLSDRQWFGLNFAPGERDAARSLLASSGMAEPFMAVSVGTKVSANDWREANWLALLERLAPECRGLGCVFIGSPDERERADAYLCRWQGPILNLCGTTSPRQSAAVLSLARVFIGHDSGPMHLAAAAGTPCVAIFAARNPPGQWFPLGEGHHVLYHKTDCHGCGLDVCVEQQKKCILSITVDEVASAVRDVLRDRLRH